MTAHSSPCSHARRATEDSQHYCAQLPQLTIVGLVSFVLYVAEKAGRNLGSNQELFEEIHMTMFTLALLYGCIRHVSLHNHSFLTQYPTPCRYAGMCLMLVGLALRGSGRARIEKLSVSQWYRHWTGAHAWQQAGAGAVGDSRVVHKPAAPSCCSRTLWWCGFGAASRQAAIARYHELRCLFVLVHELPDSFVLLYYLKKCEQQVQFDCCAAHPLRGHSVVSNIVHHATSMCRCSLCSARFEGACGQCLPGSSLQTLHCVTPCQTTS